MPALISQALSAASSRWEHGDAAALLSCPPGRGRIAFEQVVLCGGVEGRGGFVEDEQQGMLPHQGAGQAHCLPLAAG